MARRLDLPPGEAIVWAAAATSLKMEAEGPFKRTLGDIAEFLQGKYEN